jgi:NAD(P)-dependent dehydrogenase (short-subunit alcohol dehydrogenase family)
MSSRPVALVAGGSRGLGLLIARELGRQGYQPVLWARDAAELDRAVLVLADEDIQAAAMVCDVRDHELVAQQVARIEDELGPIEVAVHVAGVIQVGPLTSLTHDHFEQAIDTMQWGPVNLAMAVVPGMRARGRGRFGTIASIGGLVSVPHLLPYSTAKFGAVGFTNGLRAELAGTGVTATTVAPGLMRTGSHLRAEFTGDAAAEYAWFAPGASMPLVSMDAERAAARIVRGILRGRSIVILTPLAKVGARIQGVAPATTAAAMGVVARLLPSGPGGPTATVEGRAARRLLDSPLVERLTTWGNRAAARNNEGPA